ncbi:MAG: pantetheine-phosphate adenylyltransferase [Defluviitaleaceae bacterium]|nr:pantetheine-phosphate adenylyltransferase [Defluviitaleaceae bacterium]
MIAVYPGSFDPPTFGHIDIIERAAKISTRLIVAVAHNYSKNAMFTPDERVAMLTEICAHMPNVEITTFSGLLVEYAGELQANAIIRGLRAVSDFEYEFQMAQANRMLNDKIETLFISTSTKFSYLSSSLVKEIAELGGNVGEMTPKIVLNKILQKSNVLCYNGG